MRKLDFPFTGTTERQEHKQNEIPHKVEPTFKWGILRVIPCVYLCFIPPTTILMGDTTVPRVIC